MTKIRAGVKLFREFVGFARHNRAYWIIPLIIVLVIAGMAIVVGQNVAPLIYTMF